MTGRSQNEDVVNQSPPFEDVNLFGSDRALRDAVEREGAGDAVRALKAFGLVCGRAESFERGRLANENPPRLKTHDRFGARADIVEYHPAYRECMDISYSEGLHCSSWMHLQTSKGESSEPVPGAQVARAAAFYMAAQMEPGHCSEISMTHSAIPVLANQPELAKYWLPKLLSRSYDPAFESIDTKSSATIGLAVIEPQAGSDIAALATRAEPDTQGTETASRYLLSGRKWFVSAPMSDAFLVLAKTDKGQSCFLVPRFQSDGNRNNIQFQRLKDKLGNRSNATAEVEFRGAHGMLVGEEGGAIEVFADVATHTRLDATLSSAAMMRLALANAINHCEHRTVSNKPLNKHPLMVQVLADISLDVEAATALAFRLARAFDRSQDPRASAWRRLMTPVTKYWVCKLAPAVVAEAMECMGANGYVEDSPLAQLYREVPANTILEGAGNVLALDVLHVLQHEPDVVEIVMDDLGTAAGDDPHLKAAHARIQAMLHEPRLLDVRARGLVEALAVLAAGTILRAHAPAATADGFIATRLGSLARQTYGHGLEWVESDQIIARATPN